MARKSKQTKAEEIAKAEIEADTNDAIRWIEDVTDAIGDIAEQLDAVIETVNSHATEGNKLAVQVEALNVIVSGLRADLKTFRADVARCDARLSGLEAFETFQRNVNEINQAMRRTLAERVRLLEDAVYVREPTLWERFKARFSSDAA